ncbi:HDOD domain-containing protein [Paraglaciecola agarilytica]|uniref:HDOD domain-containing protein n=1 Tax=Paraglaciecola chathamensis TaxID=368405 RepID=UPI001C0A5957|nr:HDOD domain-containing protein [Paraglaciecola agarilytica]MBU3019289.1 HDOD domain-containing protein [Paraglaciecola agarilytica]
MSTENALLTILVEKINNDTLVLPTLPAIALKVRKAADDPNINLNAMADVIGQDPSLSARMIKISNSSYMGRSVKVTSTSQAVTRIGLRQIKNIATALAMEQLFVSKNDIVKNYLDKVWQQNLKVVAASMAVMQLHIKETKNRTLNLDTMTLAALVHNIGVLPILTEAERHPEVFANPTFLNVAIDKLAGRIGASIMREWGFEQEFVNVAENWHDMTVQTDMISYLDFTRLGAVLAGQFDSQKDALLNLAVQKGILADLSILQSEDYQDLYDSASSIFA